DGTVVPEPTTLLLLALGGLLIRKRRCAFVTALFC
ncbi:MAG: PEP-CTERM sorting domain-containing protein, partial [Planctomycetota bacterium]